MPRLESMPRIMDRRPSETPDGRSPLRVVVAAFASKPRARLASRSLRQLGIEPDQSAVLGPEIAHRWSRGAQLPAPTQTPCTLAAAEYLSTPELYLRCREWLTDGKSLLVVLPDSFPDRGRVQDLVAELGGSVLGPGGRTYP